MAGWETTLRVPTERLLLGVVPGRTPPLRKAAAETEDDARKERPPRKSSASAPSYARHTRSFEKAKKLTQPPSERQGAIDAALKPKPPERRGRRRKRGSPRAESLLAACGSAPELPAPVLDRNSAAEALRAEFPTVAALQAAEERDLILLTTVRDRLAQVEKALHRCRSTSRSDGSLASTDRLEVERRDLVARLAEMEASATEMHRVRLDMEQRLLKESGDSVDLSTTSLSMGSLFRPSQSSFRGFSISDSARRRRRRIRRRPQHERNGRKKKGKKKKKKKKEKSKQQPQQQQQEEEEEEEEKEKKTETVVEEEKDCAVEGEAPAAKEVDKAIETEDDEAAVATVSADVAEEVTDGREKTEGEVGGDGEHAGAEDAATEEAEAGEDAAEESLPTTPDDAE
eukprot:PLAT3355.14.p1 GENE.PLAT3355.14~~PLAT3355.14.p1  ORF type:complete len:400 (+),score=131.42 PLAT3355.14:69-1268(+)